MKSFDLSSQLSALTKHCKRNGLNVVGSEINKDERGGEIIYFNLSDGCYMTVFQIINKDYLNQLRGYSFRRSYASVMY